MADESKKHLLSDEDFSHNGSIYSEQPDRNERRHLFGYRIAEIFICALLLLSLCTNVLLSSFQFTKTCTKTPLRTKYAGLEYNAIEKPISEDSAYTREPSGPNDTSRDDAWDAMNIDRITIVLNHEKAASMGLEKSHDFIWDDTYGYYGVNAYHQLHCVQGFYKEIMEGRRGLPRTQKLEHLIHCADYLRQDIICNADDTLLYRAREGEGEHSPGEGHMRQCKDFSKLEEWAFEAERNACFVAWPDKSQPYTYRNWNHCPPDSPFFQKMKDHYGYDENWKIDYKIWKEVEGQPLDLS